MSVENVRTVFRGRVITVNVETVRLPDGQPVSRPLGEPPLVVTTHAITSFC